MEQGDKIILTSESEINTYINDAIDGKKGLITVAYGKVNERLAQDFQENYDGKPMDIKNFFLEFVPNDIHHAYEQHLNAKEYGDIDLSREDFENIPKYIDEYSEMLYAKKYDSGNTKIALSVKKPNGRVLVISVVSKSHGSIAFKNMIGLSEEKYIFEYENVHKNRNSSNARGSESSNTSLRDETASVRIITEKSEIVKENSENISDERKSVKRSYEPGKESEFEQKLAEKAEIARQESFNQLMFEQLEEMQSLIKNRNESFEQLLSARYDKALVTEEFENSEAISLDEVEMERLESFNQQMQEMLETTQSLINGDQSSIDAIINGNKGYTRKADIGKVISDAFEMYAIDDESGDSITFIAKDAKKEIIASVWKKVNSVKHFSKKKFASLIADQILENTILAIARFMKLTSFLKALCTGLICHPLLTK